MIRVRPRRVPSPGMLAYKHMKNLLRVWARCSFSHPYNAHVCTFEFDQLGAATVSDSQPSHRSNRLHRRICLRVLCLDPRVFRIGGRSQHWRDQCCKFSLFYFIYELFLSFLSTSREKNFGSCGYFMCMCIYIHSLWAVQVETALQRLSISLCPLIMFECI